MKIPFSPKEIKQTILETIKVNKVKECYIRPIAFFGYGKMGISQEKLIRLADVSNNTIITIEAGKQSNPTIETLKKIVKALNTPIEDLIK